MTRKYDRIQDTVDALQWDGTNFNEIVRFTHAETLRYDKLSDHKLSFANSKGIKGSLKKNDWVFRESGIYKTMANEEFVKTFQPKGPAQGGGRGNVRGGGRG